MKRKRLSRRRSRSKWRKGLKTRRRNTNSTTSTNRTGTRL